MPPTPTILPPGSVNPTTTAQSQTAPARRMSHAERRIRSERVRARVAAGEDIEAVAIDEAISLNHARRACVGLRMIRREIAERNRMIREQFSAGKELGAIAAVMGVSYGTVSGACIGLRRHPISAYGIIAALVTTDESQVEIAARFGVSRQRVQQVYQKCVAHGIPVKRTDYRRAKP